MPYVPALMCLFDQTPIMALSVCFGVAVLCFHVCAIRYSARVMLISKSVASLFFVLIGAFVLHALVTTSDAMASDGILHQTGMYLFIFVGLVFGCIGDILLGFRNIFPQNKLKFTAAGILAFAMGHIFYMMVALAYLGTSIAGKSLPVQVSLVLLPLLFSLLFVIGNIKLAERLNMSYGKLKIAVWIYCFIIAFLLASTWTGSILSFGATGAWIWLLPIFPVTLFTVSDFVLSTHYFDRDQKKITPKQVIIIHVTYYLAQFMFACACSCPAITCVGGSLF